MKFCSLLLLLLFPLFMVACSSKITTPSSEIEDFLAGRLSACAVGAFINGFSNVNDFQTRAGKKLALINWYISWPTAFPSAEADLAAANGSIPLITWEPFLGAVNTLEAIASGNCESYVRGFFRAAKNWGRPLFLRFAHEMNGDWYPWSGQQNGGSSAPAKFIAAWRYIYNVKTSEAANNVYLVWSPNCQSHPAEVWNDLVNYYPGDAYVDWIGLDGYNWGTSGGGTWSSFEQIFSAAYTTLTGLTAKPLMIPEFSSAEEGGSKATWITEAFAKIKSDYPRIKAVCWFNIDKERDWRINSSPSAEAAYKNALQESYFLGKIR